MDTPLKRLASFLAIAVLRGDNRIECGMVTDEHRPVTIEDVISPAPMNPSFISQQAKCVGIRSLPAIVDSGLVVGDPEIQMAYRADQYPQVGFSPAIGPSLLGHF